MTKREVLENLRAMYRQHDQRFNRRADAGIEDQVGALSSLILINTWALGRIIELLPDDADGDVRGGGSDRPCGKGTFCDCGRCGTFE